MPKMRKYLFPGSVIRKNVGLFLRWKLALKTMLEYAAIPNEYIQLTSEVWVNNVRSMVKKESPYLQLLSVESEYNAVNTIVSIGIAIPEEGSSDRFRFLSMDEAKVLHFDMFQGSTPLTMLGQPVKISDKHSIVRIALGADIVLQCFEDTGVDFPFAPENKSKLLSHLVGKIMDTLKTDQAVISKMSALAKSRKSDAKSINESLFCEATIRNMEAIASSFPSLKTYINRYDYNTTLANRYSTIFQTFLKSNPPSTGNYYQYHRSN